MADNHGQLQINYVMFWGIAACHFGRLGTFEKGPRDLFEGTLGALFKGIWDEETSGSD